METKPWEEMSPEEKKTQLYISQKETLDSFLACNAISKAQYNKSLGDLTEKMGMRQVLEELTQIAKQEQYNLSISLNNILAKKQSPFPGFVLSN